MNTSTDRPDTALRAWLELGPDRGRPEGLERALAATRRVPQRPGWSFPERWLLVNRTLLAAAAALVIVMAAAVVALRPATNVGPVASPTPGLTAATAPESVAPAPTEQAQGPAALVAYTVSVRRDPCGSRLAVQCTDTQLWIANADGSNAHQLFGKDGESYHPLGWSADGSRLLIESSSGLVLTDAGGAEQQTVGGDVTCPRPAKGEKTTSVDFCTGAEGYSLSPDGTRVAFVRNYGNLDGMTIVAILDIAAGTVTELPATKTTNGSEQCQATRDCQGLNDTPRWSPDGRTLVFARQVMSPEPGSTWTSAAIYTIGADGTGLQRVTPTGMYAFDPSWSPDGSTIAFVNTEMIVNAKHTSVTDMLNDVYTIGSDGSGMRRLTDDGTSYAPHWTSSGRISFTRVDSTWVMDANGTNATQLDFDLAHLTAAGCVVCRYPGPDPQVGTAWWQPVPPG